jgi:L-seryl-tRNA(Ser) seleniumtransferase
VIVSRGQLVEIGGSYRLPEIFEAAGVRLREVGTTNRTALPDYARAVGPETAAILRVHPSNFRVIGFTGSVPIAELTELARAAGIACIDDVGSGRLRPDLPPGLGDEPSVSEGVAAGADLVLFSGDKLLGGPQSGLIVGRPDAVARVKRDPLSRPFRVDKLTLAALAATLRLALASTPSDPRIPLWRRLAVPIDALQARAEAMATRLVPLNYRPTVEPTEAMLGGGSDPARPIPSRAVCLAPPYPAPGMGEGDLARALRLGEPSVVPRVHGGAVLFDLRAVAPDEDATIVSALAAIARPG